MTEPDPIVQDRPAATTGLSHALDASPVGASSPHPSPTEAPALPRALLRGLLLPILAWLALAAVLALAAGVGPAAVAQGGWRLHAYRELAVAAFLLALVAGGWAAIAHELRRRTAKRAGDARE